MKRKRKPSGGLAGALVRELKRDFGGALDVITEGAAGAARRGRIGTGALNLDWALSGGLPVGRLTEMFSRRESQGKTSVGYSAIMSAQAAKDLAILLDVEHDLKYGDAHARLVSVGIDTKNLIVGQPKTIEGTFAMCEALILGARRRGHQDNILIVWDSLAATPAASQQDADEYEDVQPAAQARAVSHCLKTFPAILADNGAAMLVINQARQDIGSRFGRKYESVAGAAMKFHAACRIEMWRGRDSVIEGPGDTQLGIVVTASVVKCKVGPPFRKVELDILFASGLDQSASSLRMAIEVGLVKPDRGSSKYIAQGEIITKAEFEQYLTDNPKFEAALYAAFEKAISMPRKGRDGG